MIIFANLYVYTIQKKTIPTIGAYKSMNANYLRLKTSILLLFHD